MHGELNEDERDPKKKKKLTPTSSENSAMVSGHPWREQLGVVYGIVGVLGTPRQLVRFVALCSRKGCSLICYGDEDEMEPCGEHA